MKTKNQLILENETLKKELATLRLNTYLAIGSQTARNNVIPLIRFMRSVVNDLLIGKLKITPVSDTHGTISLADSKVYVEKYWDMYAARRQAELQNTIARLNVESVIAVIK